MYATRFLFVFLFVVCASSRLVASQDNLINSFMDQMNSRMDGLAAQLQDIGQMIMGNMNGQMMDDFTSRLRDVGGQLMENINGEFASRIMDAGETMMNNMQTGMMQGGEFLNGHIMPQIQEMRENMQSFIPGINEK